MGIRFKGSICNRNEGSCKPVGRYEAVIRSNSNYYDRLYTYAGKLDGHFLLFTNTKVEDYRQRLFGIVDEDKVSVADKRLYDKAYEFLRVHVEDCDIDDRTRYAQREKRLEVSAAES